MRVAVATCAAVPHLDEDGPLLMAALADAGLDAAVTVWDDPSVPWSDFELVLIRSTWDYPLRRAEFVAWVNGCRRTINPGGIVTWNTDKTYLRDLDRAGVPTVPTEFVPPGTSFDPPDGTFVVKPTVSCSAADTARFAGDATEPARSLVDALHAQGRTAMVQPYVKGIDTEGETSLVFLGGNLSHAVRRAPVLASASGRRTGVSDRARPLEPTQSQRALALAALAAVPGGADQLSYARVDLVPGPDGPLLLELELTEPFLFLSSAPPYAIAELAANVAGGR